MNLKEVVQYQETVGRCDHPWPLTEAILYFSLWRVNSYNYVTQKRDFQQQMFWNRMQILR